MIPRSDDGKIRILSLSYGKDSMACLGAIEQLGWPLDGIVTADVWATQDIPADLPPMVEFKTKADAIIKERCGVEVKHCCAMRGGQGSHMSGSSSQSQSKADTENTSTGSRSRQEAGARSSNTGMKLTYEDIFYRPIKNPKVRRGGLGAIYGFATTNCPWCNNALKVSALREAKRNIWIPVHGGRRTVPQAQGRGSTDFRCRSGGELVYCPQDKRITGFATRASQYCTGEIKRAGITDSLKSKGPGATVISNARFSNDRQQRGGEKNIVVSYLGIAADEPKRLERLDGKTKVSPLAAIGWTEADCRSWCERNGLLSPIYTTATRGGCWFCHNQSIGQLRLLRKNYPDLWALLLKWDSDSPVTFRPDGHTVHDFDRRFAMEDKLGREIPKFRWNMLEQGVQLTMYDLIKNAKMEVQE